MNFRTIRARLVVSRFTPFEVRTTDGGSFVVSEIERASLSPGGRRLIVWVADEQAVHLDVAHIESIRE